MRLTKVNWYIKSMKLSPITYGELEFWLTLCLCRFVEHLYVPVLFCFNPQVDRWCQHWEDHLISIIKVGSSFSLAWERTGLYSQRLKYRLTTQGMIFQFQTVSNIDEVPLQDETESCKYCYKQQENKPFAFLIPSLSKSFETEPTNHPRNAPSHRLMDHGFHLWFSPHCFTPMRVFQRVISLIAQQHKCTLICIWGFSRWDARAKGPHGNFLHLPTFRIAPSECLKLLLSVQQELSPVIYCVWHSG